MPRCNPVLRPLTMVAACLVLAACASGGPPAPIVPRTTPGPAAAPARAAPAVPPPVVAAPAVPTPTVPDAPAVATSPVRSGSVESRGIESRPLEPSPPASAAVPPPPASAPAPTLPPNTRTAPRGVKVPFSDSALAELRSAEAPAAAAGAAPGPGATASSAAGAATAVPAPGVVVPPAKPAEAKAEPPAAAVAAPATGGADTWGWPTSGRVVQTFDESSKKGIAFSGKAGDPVMAAADGRVIFSGNGPRGYGNLVIVKHANDLLSVYAHNRSLAVKEGQDVKRGQKIAEVGDSGTTSARLHFEIRQQGKPVDPAKFLPRR
jgi:lipoprotein NlpD